MTVQRASLLLAAATSIVVLGAGACGTASAPNASSDAASAQASAAGSQRAQPADSVRLAAGRSAADSSAGAAGGAAMSGMRATAVGGAVAAAMGGMQATRSAGASMQAGASGNGLGGAGAAAAAGGSGVPAAGSGAPRKTFDYLIGADVTDQEPATPEVRAKLLRSMLAHGFNAIRLRTFVDPRAADGYDQKDGYGDLAHTIDFGKQIKAAGMFLAIDFHYSDNWADPGKQCVPIAWQQHKNISELAAALGDYTRDSVQQLIAAGARPDLVQIGNEITPGMLLHRCDSRGLPTGDHNVRGSTEHWPDLGALLKAGVDAVRGLDPSILIALHIDRGGDKVSDTPGSALGVSVDFLSQASQYVRVDALGESCYQRYQGDPASAERSKAGWRSTLAGVLEKFPDIQIYAAEYGPAQREINDVVFELADQRGLGTFNWEPTTQGDWNTGHDLWRRTGDDYTEQPDLKLYDQMKLDYAARL